MEGLRKLTQEFSPVSLVREGLKRGNIGLVVMVEN